ncbi:MAG: tetratricopeptide repeat protein [Pirellulaceae bacterium]
MPESSKDDTQPNDQNDLKNREKSPAPGETVHQSDEARKLAAELSVDKRQSIGRYKILQPIGEGGMGEVFLAEQDEPVRRRVALKVIREGHRSDEILTRFEAERQALAMMDHPCIARILDAGTTIDGKPYFAMEFVNGLPLTEFCDDRQMSLSDRLKLFAEVCDAVQHAHQKGIIHRDLKPSNIIVTEVNGRGIPKVIDFGLAKALDSTEQLTEHPLRTEYGRVLGTLKYMSPEQAGFQSLDIDTRSDVYSLGVILYELLTGTTPLEDSVFDEYALLKILELIREQDSPRPSQRLNASNHEHLAKLTQRRKTDSRRLDQILTGDLDWVVMKSLEKDRVRRYHSAAELAADIQRFLRNEPVIARPPSWNYLARKFVAKNRVTVVAASVVFLALVGGIVGTSAGMVRAIRAEKEADDRFKDAQANFAFAQSGNEILGTVFEDLDPDAEYTTVADLRNALKERLESAANKLDSNSIGSPLAVAKMHFTLGKSLLNLGQYDSAIALFEKCQSTRIANLSAEHLDSLRASNGLAMAYSRNGDWDKALSLQKQVVGLSASTLNDNDPDLIRFRANLGLIYLKMGQFSTAQAFLEEALDSMRNAHGVEHDDTLNAMSTLGALYYEQDQIDKTIGLLEETFAIQKEKYGIDHPKSLRSMGDLATTLGLNGQTDRAISLLEQALKLKIDRFGSDHPETIGTLGNLGLAYWRVGRLQDAIPLLERELKFATANLGFDHPDTMASMNRLAVTYVSSGEINKALPLFENALAIRRVKLGADHVDTLMSASNLAGLYYEVNQLDKAIELLKPILAASGTAWS